MSQQNEKSGGSSGTEDIRTKVAPRDLAVGDGLDCVPILRVEKDAVLEPVRDGLLLETGPLHNFRQTLGESCLAAAGRGDRAPERSNVRLLHSARPYTSFLVGVNKETSLTNNKEPCNVLQMPAAQRKDQKP